MSTWRAPKGYRQTPTPSQTPSQLTTMFIPPEDIVPVTPEKVDYFREYLETSDSSDNKELLLHMEIEVFRKHVKASRHLSEADKKQAEAIYTKFIKNGAPMQVDLPRSIRKSIS